MFLGFFLLLICDRAHAYGMFCNVGQSTKCLSVTERSVGSSSAAGGTYWSSNVSKLNLMKRSICHLVLCSLDLISEHSEMISSPVLSELHSKVSFSALSPGLGPCFIHVAMVNWSVRFCGTT